MVVIEIKISIILVEKFFSYFDGYAIPTSIISFSSWNSFNALPLGEVVSGDNRNL